jgi:hypothetical protein
VDLFKKSPLTPSFSKSGSLNRYDKVGWSFHSGVKTTSKNKAAENTNYKPGH